MLNKPPFLPGPLALAAALVLVTPGCTGKRTQAPPAQSRIELGAAPFIQVDPYLALHRTYTASLVGGMPFPDAHKWDVDSMEWRLTGTGRIMAQSGTSVTFRTENEGKIHLILNVWYSRPNPDDDETAISFNGDMAAIDTQVLLPPVFSAPFSVSPASIPPGGNTSVSLTWAFQDPTGIDVAIDNNVTVAGGSPATDRPKATTTYTLTATNKAGQRITATAVANVTDPDQTPLPTFVADPPSVTQFQGSTLRLTLPVTSLTPDAMVLQAENDAPQPFTGSTFATGPLAKTRTYWLTAFYTKPETHFVKIPCTVTVTQAPAMISEVQALPTRFPREGHASVALTDGSVLTAGGRFDKDTILNKAFRYDPTPPGTVKEKSLDQQRFMPAMALLPNGKVLLAGGTAATRPLANFELFDWAAQEAAPSRTWDDARIGATAVVLADGTVLLLGGTYSYQTDDGRTTSLAILDPDTKTLSRVENASLRQGYYSAVLLQNGTVLIVGDVGSRTGWLFDPVAKKLVTTPWPMRAIRVQPALARLADGRVLVVGGGTDLALQNPPVATVEIYDPATGLFTRTGDLVHPRAGAQATVLPGGDVLITGGTLTPVAAEKYLVQEGRFLDTQAVPAAESRTKFASAPALTATSLPDGRVFLAGGMGIPNPAQVLDANQKDAGGNNVQPWFAFNPPVRVLLPDQSPMAPIEPVHSAKPLTWTLRPDKDALPGLVIDPHTGILTGSTSPGPLDWKLYFVTATDGVNAMTAPLWISIPLL